MPGTFVLKPIEANLTHNTDLIGRMNPYCTFTLNGNRLRGQVCKKGGKHPHWDDAITIPTINTAESKMIVELMDKDRITHDDSIGSFVLDLTEVQASGHLNKWYPLYYKNRHAGDILMDCIYEPAGGLSSQPIMTQEERLMTEPTLPDEGGCDTLTYIESLKRGIVLDQIPTFHTLE